MIPLASLPPGSVRRGPDDDQRELAGPRVVVHRVVAAGWILVAAARLVGPAGAAGEGRRLRVGARARGAVVGLLGVVVDLFVGLLVVVVVVVLCESIMWLLFLSFLWLS